MEEKLNTLKQAINDEEFMNLIKDLYTNETVNKMKEYRQHCDISTFEHSLNVSYISYKICKKLNLDYKSMARAALLHDLFLYDWRNSKKELKLEGYHAFVHPKIALKNAVKLYELNEKEQDIIIKHMWPVTLAMPKYKETWIITLVDKYSAILETREYIKKKLQTKKAYRYAYVFLCLLFVGRII